jgi:ComF family protein
MIMVNNWLAGLLPSRCLLCGMDAHSRGLCRACHRDLPAIAHPCPLCALPLPTVDALACGRCLGDPPPWRRCVSALLYEEPASHLIAALKYRARLPVARLLAEALTEQIGPSPQIDAILPVPLHWRRRWQRAFNQTETIADELGRRLHLPVHSRWLQRERATPAQQSLTAAERARNLRGAFALRHPIAGLRIAVVDDVVTTGHTATEITRLLLENGAAAVDVWSLARTPH